MDVPAMAVWMTSLSTLLRDFELGTPMTIQYVHDLLSQLDGFRMWHGDICLFQGLPSTSLTNVQVDDIGKCHS